MLSTGTVLEGKYKILRRIGSGGTSHVYLAVNEAAGRFWAIKVIRPAHDAEAEIRHEISMLKRMKHPSIPAVADVLEYDGCQLVVMDYIEGKNLEEVLKSEGRQPVERVTAWALELCDVMAYLHSQDPPVIFRDLKPSNIIRKEDGKLVLVDFGAARIFNPHAGADTVSLGTREYAAPEQFGTGQSDKRTDIYNFGATLFHLLSGKYPSEVHYRTGRIGMVIPALKGSGIERLIGRCCRADPEERFQDCGELYYALCHLSEENRIDRKMRSRKKRSFLALVFLAVLCLFCSCCCSYVRTWALEETYFRYLEEGEERGYEELEHALSLCPERIEAFTMILDRVMKDHFFTEEESRMLTSADSRFAKAVSVLERKDAASFSRIAYRLGNMYYFYYPSTDYRSLGAAWFSKISDPSGLSEEERNLAYCLESVGRHYDDLKKPDPYGKGQFDYGTLWEEYVFMTDLCLRGRVEGSEYSVLLYGEFLVEIYNHAREFAMLLPEPEMKEEFERLASAVGDLNSPYPEIAERIGATCVLVRKIREEKVIEQAYRWQDGEETS